MAVNVNGGALEFDAVINAAQFNAAISSIERQLAGLTTTAERESSAIDNLVRKTTTAIAAYATFLTSTNFVGDIVRVRGEFQQLEVAFSTMLGSKEKADRLLAQVTEFAATTPFELQDVAKATKQLLAFGIESDSIIETLRSLGDVSAGLGQPLGEIAYLFGTIKTQGKAASVDIKQFAQRGIPIYEELAKVLGVTVDKVDDFITAGKVGFPEVEQVFKNLTAEGSKFGGLMEAQSKTLTGQISNLRDAWQQMLNTIGKGQEGLFSDIISGATFVVKNFQTVIDILGVLVITYGSYRAAIIATNAVTAISTAVTKGYTIAETLRYHALLLSERAMKILNATALANPFVAVTTAVAALVAALLIFNKRSSEAKTRSELLADAQKKVGDKLSETRAKIEPYLNALQNANISEQDRIRIYNELIKIDPKIVDGLNAKTLSYENLKKNVDLYLGALRKQIALETNKEALVDSIKNEQAIQNKIKETQKKIDEVNKRLNSQSELQKNLQKAGFSDNLDVTLLNNLQNKLNGFKKDLEDQKKTSTDLGQEQVNSEKAVAGAKERTVAVIEEEIKALKDQQANTSTNAKQFQDYQKKINALEEEKKRIVGASKSDARAAQAEENKANALLEKRKDLLQQIDDLKRQSDRSGLVKEQTELDRINERYDDVIRNITEYNAKVDEFNKKNPKNQVQKVGQADITALNDARNTELDNTKLKQQADEFKKNLEKQREVFIQFEEAKKEVGIAKAREMFKEQTKDYDNFLQLLQQEAARLLPLIQLGIANVGEVEKFKAIMDQITQYNKEKSEQQVEDEKRKFVELLSASATYNQERAAINKKYDELEATLRANSTISEFDERKKLLDQSRKEELEELKNSLTRESEIYKKLNEDIINFSRKKLRERISDLKELLKKDSNITPQMKADIEAVINQYESLLDETVDISKKFKEVASVLGTLSGAFSNLGSSLEGVNDDLAEILSTLGDIASIGASAAQAIGSFASGDIIGGITNAISAIAGLFSLGRKAREERKRQQQEIEAFYNRIFLGEQQINVLYRERAREQAKLNKLRLEGLKSEYDLLVLQKKQVQDQFNTVLSELQKLKAKIRKQISPLGIEVFSTESLAGKSFDELEQLFLKGQLEGKAKELFELLQRLKQEGADVDALLEQNKLTLQETLTGTSTDSISDAIIEGFKNGKRGAADFADTFQDLMRQALIQSLKFKYLEGPLKEFFEEFASATESDNTLTQGEVSQLQQLFNTIITNANQQFEQLQQIAGINFNTGSSPGNTLTGAVKGITEETAALLAGQFGGLRLTAIDILNVTRQQLTALNKIEVNTGTSAVRLQGIIDKMIYYFENKGVKII